MRLGDLPKTLPWKKVIELLEHGADLAALADASMYASKTGLKRVPSDPGFCSVLTNIFQFVEAARSREFVQSLREHGFQIGEQPTLLDLVTSLQSKNDIDLSRYRIKSDVAEIAQNAFAETLLAHSSIDQPALFEITAIQVHRQLAKDLGGKGFGNLMHEFYSSFTHRYLTYYLSRELPRHIGRDSYFGTLASQREFNDALDLYIRQSIRIVDEFTPGWLGKAIWEGSLDREGVTQYAHGAFKKISSEFARSSGDDG